MENIIVDIVLALAILALSWRLGRLEKEVREMKP